MPEGIDPLTVNTPSDDSGDDPTQEIGRRVASHRARLGRKVSELARQAQVSPSLISQIERGQSRPSVSTLFAIAAALDLPVDAFFRSADDAQNAATTGSVQEPTGTESGADGTSQDGPQHRYLVRNKDRATIDIEGGVRWERLTPTTLDNAEFLELVYAPGAQSHTTLYRHPGTEMVLVLSGRLDIFVGFERFELAPGDSIHFPSSLPHRYVNPTDEESRAVTVILHDEQSHSPSANRRRP